MQTLSEMMIIDACTLALRTHFLVVSQWISFIYIKGAVFRTNKAEQIASFKKVFREG